MRPVRWPFDSLLFRVWRVPSTVAPFKPNTAGVYDPPVVLPVEIPDQTVAIGQALEADTAQALTVVAELTVAIGQAFETDTAQALTAVPGEAVVPVGQALEADTARRLVYDRTVAIGQALETDTARALVVVDRARRVRLSASVSAASGIRASVSTPTRASVRLVG